jgi:hypothetical protein
MPAIRASGGGLTGALVAVLMSGSAAIAGDEIVDVELVLAVDVSLSMSPEELAIQRDGYARALTDERVLNAIRDGAHGKIAITYMEWAGDTVQKVIVPWMRVSSRAEAEDFVMQMTANPPSSARRTSISGGLDYAGGLFEESGFRGMKRVIDISGDGPNNQGPPVHETRDRLVEAGITINGLPLMTNGGLASAFDVVNLDDYYTSCVIGGPGAFVIPVNEWSQFPEAVRRKLVLELAGVDSRAWAREDGGLPVLKIAETFDVDCLIGEKMWNSRSWMWEGR